MKGTPVVDHREVVHGYRRPDCYPNYKPTGDLHERQPEA
jgi:hypothetical protein